MATWNNSVPQGVAGTGDAVIFGPNTAADNYGSQLQGLRQRQQMEEQRRLLQAQQIAKDYRDNALKVSSGRLWSSELANQVQNHINKGIDYKTQGRNIYDPTDPDYDTYMGERANLEAMQAYRQGVEQQYNKGIDLLAKSAPGEYDPDSVRAFNDFVKNTDLETAFNTGAQVPQLQKSFNPSTVLRGVKAATTENVANGVRQVQIDRPATENAILGTVLRSPGGNQYLSRITGGINPQEVRQFPSSIEDNIKEIQEMYQGSPALRTQMARDLGISDPNSPEFEQAVRQIATTRSRAKKNLDDWLGDQVATASAGVKTSSIPVKGTEMTDYQRQSLQVQREREARLRDQQSGSSTSSTARAARIQSSVEPTATIPFGKGNPDGSRTTVNVSNKVALPVPSKPMSIDRAIDLKTGRYVNLKTPSDKYEIVSLADVPVNKTQGWLVQPRALSANPKNVKYQKMALIRKQGTQGEQDVDYLIDISQLPVNSFTKEQKETVDYFRGLEPVKQTGTVKGQFKGVPAGGF